MKNLLIQITLCCFCLLLESCLHRPVSITNTSCASACAIRMAECTKTCRNNCPLCSVQANEKAAKKYKKYQCEQIIKGKIIALQLNSFRDPLQCRKITCDCPADYEVCMKSCGGRVLKRTTFNDTRN